MMWARTGSGRWRGTGRHRRFAWPVRAALCAAAVLWASLQTQPAAAQADGERFRQLTRMSDEAFLAQRYEDAERLLVQAADLGPLDQARLRVLSWMRRSFLGRPEDSLPVAKLCYREHPGYDSVIELCESYADNADYAAARGLLASELGIETGTSPAACLASVLDRLDDVERGQGHDTGALRGTLERVAVKHYELTFTLSPCLLRPERTQEALRDGYMRFSLYPDCRNQRLTYEVVDAERVEEVTDRAGNRRLSVWLKPDVSPRLVAHLTLVPEGFDVRRTEAQAGTPPDALLPYLDPTPLIDPEGPTATALAAQLRGVDRLETLRNIDKWFRGFHYAGASVDGSEAALRERRATCWNCSRAVAAILRAMGIPARQIYTLQINGTMLHLPLNPSLGGHFLCEFYDPVYGWIAFSPSYESNGRPQMRPLTEAREDCIKLVAEDPDETDPIGGCALQYARMWYGWKHTSTTQEGDVPGDLINTDLRLIGLSFDEPPPLAP